jgi:hypothetical protein
MTHFYKVLGAVALTGAFFIFWPIAIVSILLMKSGPIGSYNQNRSYQQEVSDLEFIGRISLAVIGVIAQILYLLALISIGGAG